MIKRFLERCVPIPCTKPVSLLLQCSYLEARIYHLPAEFGQQALSQWSCSRGGRSKWGGHQAASHGSEVRARPRIEAHEAPFAGRGVKA